MKKPPLGSGDTLDDGSREDVDADAPKYFAGDVISGKYQLTHVIGEGGMGSVWLARNLALDADVCVKLIRRDAATLQASQRLLQEARAAARLSHPSIVRVFDFGETEQRDPFIVMEVLRGDSLRRLMTRKTRLAAASAVATLLPVASALAEAHSKAVIHRDLKPENIVLVADESGAVIPKVVDFGVAKIRRGDAERGLTQDGSVLGSPEYMSPEQAQGRSDVDERSDVWAFSVMLYELLTGRLPFRGDNYNALLWAIQREEPEPTTQLAAGDAELWRLIQRGLAKAPGERWGSMRDFGMALAEWALKNGVEVDVTGGSVALGWLAGTRRPHSEAPSAVLRSPSIANLEESRNPSPPRSGATSRPNPRNGWSRGAAFVSCTWARVWPCSACRQLAYSWRCAVRVRQPPVPARRQRQWQPPSAAYRASTAPPASATALSPAESASTPTAPSSPPKATTSLVECAAAVFPPGTLSTTANSELSFLCADPDPRTGSQQLEAVVIKSRGAGVSLGMQEWAQLNWYELAMFSIVRSRCCNDPPPLRLPSNGGVCTALESVLDDLGRAVHGNRDVEPTLTRSTETVTCLVAKGGAGPCPHSLARLEGARPAFKRCWSAPNQPRADPEREDIPG